jgi:uncharacterized protein (UPF0276 family)
MVIFDHNTPTEEVAQPPIVDDKISRFRVPDLGIGVGFHSVHEADVLSERGNDVDWLELLAEHHVAEGGRGPALLVQLRQRYRLVPHATTCNLGGSPLVGQLDALARLVTSCGAPWASDHLCFIGHPHRLVHELLPVSASRDMLGHVTDRIKEVQDRLGVPFALENIGSCMLPPENEFSEAQFLALIAEQADCALLIDVNNIYVSANNFGFDPLAYLDALPADRVVQLHLGGHRVIDDVYIDSHDGPVSEPVWRLYEEAIHRFGRVSTSIEWDANIPSWDVLMRDVAKARSSRAGVIRE